MSNQANMDSFNKDLKFLILKHIGSGNLEIVGTLKLIKGWLVNKLTCIDKYTLNKFRSYRVRDWLHMVMWALWGGLCAILTWFLLYGI